MKKLEEAVSENEEISVISIKPTRSYIVDSDTDLIGICFVFWGSTSCKRKLKNYIQ